MPRGTTYRANGLKVTLASLRIHIILRLVAATARKHSYYSHHQPHYIAPDHREGGNRGSDSSAAYGKAMARPDPTAHRIPDFLTAPPGYEGNFDHPLRKSDVAAYISAEIGLFLAFLFFAQFL